MASVTPQKKNQPFLFGFGFLISPATWVKEEICFDIGVAASSSTHTRRNVLYGFTGVKGIFIITRQTCRKLSRRQAQPLRMENAARWEINSDQTFVIHANKIQIEPCLCHVFICYAATWTSLMCSGSSSTIKLFQIETSFPNGILNLCYDSHFKYTLKFQ